MRTRSFWTLRTSSKPLIPLTRTQATRLCLSVGLSLLVLAPPVSAQQDARARAEAARRTLQQLQRAAQAAGAEGFADVADLIGEAGAREQVALTAFGGGDFAAALTGFEAAVQAIQRAVGATAAAATAARQQAEAASRGALQAVAGAPAKIDQGLNLERRGRFNDARLAYLAATSMYEGGIGATAGTAAAGGSPLLAVLQGYEAAMEAEDIAAYRALWVDIDPDIETGVANSFEQFDSWQIEYSETEIVVEGAEAATLRAIQSLRFVDAATGNAVEARTRVTFTLRKSAAGWLIEALTQEAIQ